MELTNLHIFSFIKGIYTPTIDYLFAFDPKLESLLVGWMGGVLSSNACKPSEHLCGYDYFYKSSPNKLSLRLCFGDVIICIGYLKFKLIFGFPFYFLLPFSSYSISSFISSIY